MSSYKPYSYTSIAFFILSISIQAQSLSFGEGRKRSLLEGIKPPQTATNLNLKLSNPEPKAITNDELPNIIRSHQSGGEEFEGEYTTKALEMSLKDIDLFKLDSGVNTKVVIAGGKMRLLPKKDYEFELDRLSQRQRLQGIMPSITYGGLNLSGWKKKKLSKKTREILEKIYLMKIEED